MDINWTVIDSKFVDNGERQFKTSLKGHCSVRKLTKRSGRLQTLTLSRVLMGIMKCLNDYKVSVMFILT